MIIFISVNALILSDEYIGYGRANEQTFETIFLPDDMRYDGLYSLTDTLDLVSHTVITVSFHKRL